MTEYRWLTRRMVEAFHQESLARFGGEPGIRDEGLLENALERPQNRTACRGDATVFALAADYCAGLVRIHPFVDGNKRAGLLSASVFLALNGYLFEPDEAVAVEMIRGLAAGDIEGEALALWIEASSSPRE